MSPSSSSTDPTTDPSAEGSETGEDPGTTTDAPGTTTDDPGTTTDESTTGSAESSGDETAAETIPAAPTDLAVSMLNGGAHLTWTDNSDNETRFVIMRADNGGDFAMVAGALADAVMHHDMPGSGSFAYYIYAENSAGMSDPTAEVMLVLP